MYICMYMYLYVHRYKGSDDPRKIGRYQYVWAHIGV